MLAINMLSIIFSEKCNPQKRIQRLKRGLRFKVNYILNCFLSIIIAANYSAKACSNALYVGKGSGSCWSVKDGPR